MESVYWYRSGAQIRIQCVTADDNFVPRAVRERETITSARAAEPLQELLETDSHGALTWAELPWARPTLSVASD